MSFIEKISRLFKSQPELTEEERAQKLREIRQASAEAHQRKALENAQKKTQLSLAPKMTLEDLGLSSYLEEQAQNTAAKWSLELLQSLEWKIFEEVCKEYLVMKSYDAKLTGSNAEGGVDIKIYRNQRVVALVQCKTWVNEISLEEIRELYEIMTAAEVAGGIFFTTAVFTEQAIIFKQNKNITLIDGEDFISRIKELKAIQQQQLYHLATVADYRTPTCIKCLQKMVKQSDQDSGHNFWQCVNYPLCQNRL